MKSFIFIPFINGLELLEKAIRSIDHHIHDEYLIFNNSGVRLPDGFTKNTPFREIFYEKRISYLKMQSYHRAYAILGGFDFYLNMHHDAEVLDDSHTRLVKAATELKDKWGVIFTMHDVLAAFNTQCMLEVGEWGDDEWPKEQMVGYFADTDYYTRVVVADFPLYNLQRHNIQHFGSATIKTSEKEMNNYRQTIQNVKEHLVRKWGLDNDENIGEKLRAMHPRNLKVIDL